MVWFTHLILSGGGLNGISFLGALHYMIKYRWIITSTLKVIVGSSIGSMITALLLIGYTPKEMFSKAISIEIDEIFSIEVSKLVNLFGVDSGEKIVNKLETMFEFKGIPKHITFLELYERTHQRLVMSATCVNKHEVHYFDYLITPQLRVIDGIRASISIPFLLRTMMAIWLLLEVSSMRCIEQILKQIRNTQYKRLLMNVVVLYLSFRMERNFTPSFSIKIESDIELIYP